MRTYQIVNFTFPADYRVKLKESDGKDKYLDLFWKLPKLLNMKVTVIPVVFGVFLCSQQRFGKRTWCLGNKRSSGDNLNYSIVEIGQNTVKSSGDLKRLVDTQIQWKTLGFR